VGGGERSEPREARVQSRGSKVAPAQPSEPIGPQPTPASQVPEDSVLATRESGLPEGAEQSTAPLGPARTHSEALFKLFVAGVIVAGAAMTTLGFAVGNQVDFA